MPFFLLSLCFCFVFVFVLIGVFVVAATVYIDIYIGPGDQPKRNQTKTTRRIATRLLLVFQNVVQPNPPESPFPSRPIETAYWKLEGPCYFWRYVSSNPTYLSINTRHKKSIELTAKNCKIEAAKREGQILGRSLLIHRPVWATGGTAMYTTAGAVYLTLRCLKRIR